MKIRGNNNFFPSLNVINGKTSPYVSKGILRNFNYRSDPKLVMSIVEIRRIPFTEQLHYFYPGIQKSKK